MLRNNGSCANAVNAASAQTDANTAMTLWCTTTIAEQIKAPNIVALAGTDIPLQPRRYNNKAMISAVNTGTFTPAAMSKKSPSKSTAARTVRRSGNQRERVFMGSKGLVQFLGIRRSMASRWARNARSPATLVL